MLYVLGETVVIPWTVLDLNDAPLTGITTPAGITFSVKRLVGASFIATGETVSFVEDGTSGTYEISFTPAQTGHYWLQLTEIDVQTLQRIETFGDIDILAAASFSPNITDAFCSQSDIERWTQLKFSSASKPTAAELAAFAVTRAAEIMGICAAEGFTITPSTVAQGSIEQNQLRECNAIAAAGDAILAKFQQESPSRTFKAANLYDEYQKRLTRLVAYLSQVKTYIGIRTHITSGEVTLPTELPIEDQGFKRTPGIGAISMTEEF